MAKNKYYTLYTDKGRKRINELLAEGKDLTFTHIAVGDGGGFVYDPEAGQESLRREVYRGSINAKLVDPDDPNQIIFQLVIPVSVGGFYIREAGLFDESGLMIAVSKTSESYKPNVTDGSGKEVKLSFIMALSNAENITINIPDSITFATQEYVLQQIQKGIELHCNADDPHEQYLKEQEYNQKIIEIEGNINSKAASNHNHDSTYLKKTDASSTYATKTELNNGLAGKAATNHSHSNYAASNHNHDSVYSKNNHTHTGYAASNHNHAFSAITGSMAITDKRLTGNLPVARVTGAAGKPTVTVTDSAKWIEILLNNGEVLLYGYGVVADNKTGVHNITLPKIVKELGKYNYTGIKVPCYGHVTITAGFMGIGASKDAYTAACANNNFFMLIPTTGENGNIFGCTWEYVGILA